MKNIQLSKSEFMMFLKHPVWLWLKKHDKSKIPPIDDALQARFDEGNRFEEIAEKLFPKGIRLGFDGYKEYLDLPYRTQETINKDVQTIFQGRFESNNITCIVDVLDKAEDGTYNLYEIKSGTKVKPEHEYDLSFQTIVLESAGIELKNISVIHVNKEYVRDGEVNPKEISTTVDVTNDVRSKIEQTQRKIQEAFEVIEQKEMPDISPRYLSIASMSEWMEIYKNIAGETDKFSIYNLFIINKKKIGELEDMEVELINDIPEDFKLSERQQAQVLATKTDRQHINKEEIEGFLSDFKYPLYFLDYETLSSLAPAFDGIKPYQQVPFQYSLHVLESPDAELVHKEYLHTENDNPVPNLLKQLKEDIGSSGSIIVWHKNFEMGRNKEMAEMETKYSGFLEDLNNRIVDLKDPFSNSWFVDKDFLGSASIKNVLPVLVPELSYEELDIQDGEYAQRIWMETILGGENQDKREKIMGDLLKYCNLDTLAMVEIWKTLRNL